MILTTDKPKHLLITWSKKNEPKILRMSRGDRFLSVRKNGVSKTKKGVVLYGRGDPCLPNLWVT